jgi:hypothetical protein
MDSRLQGIAACIGRLVEEDSRLQGIATCIGRLVEEDSRLKEAAEFIPASYYPTD